MNPIAVAPERSPTSRPGSSCCRCPAPSMSTRRSHHQALLGLLNVFCLGVAEGPDFVALDLAGCNVAHRLIVVESARLSRIHQQLSHRVDRNVSRAGDLLHGHALDEHGEDHGAVVRTASIVSLSRFIKQKFIMSDRCCRIDTLGSTSQYLIAPRKFAQKSSPASPMEDTRTQPTGSRITRQSRGRRYFPASLFSLQMGARASRVRFGTSPRSWARASNSDVALPLSPGKSTGDFSIASSGTFFRSSPSVTRESFAQSK